MISQLSGAALRALLVGALVATPALILPGAAAETNQVVVFVALFGAALVFVEYAAVYPGLIEFRYAPPFNRLRFAGLYLTVVLLSLLFGGHAAAGGWLPALAAPAGIALDLPYSPVRMAALMLPATASPEDGTAVRAGAALALLVAALTVSVFLGVIWFGRWPIRGGGFNLWVNLPTFDSSLAGDVVTRLERDAVFNLALGIMLPYLIPVVVKSAAASLGPLSLAAPQSLVWLLGAWAFLPASLIMRGLALNRIAALIRAQRAARGEDDTLAPA